nr:hypothetical protein GCM10017547_42260 [Pseudarthrobacter oxydans]
MIATVKCAGECLVTSAPPLRSPAGAHGGVDRFIKPDLHVPPRAGLGRETDNQLHVSVSLSHCRGHGAGRVALPAPWVYFAWKTATVRAGTVNEPPAGS